MLLETDIPTGVEKLKMQTEIFSLKTNKQTQKQNETKNVPYGIQRVLNNRCEP